MSDVLLTDGKRETCLFPVPAELKSPLIADSDPMPLLCLPPSQFLVTHMHRLILSAMHLLFSSPRLFSPDLHLLLSHTNTSHSLFVSLLTTTERGLSERDDRGKKGSHGVPWMRQGRTGFLLPQSPQRCLIDEKRISHLFR